MFGLLNTTQVYGIQHQEHEPKYEINFQTSTPKSPSSSFSSTSQPTTSTTTHRRSQSSVSDNGSNRFFSSITSKSPTTFIEKFLKSDLLATYETIKNYRNFPTANQSASATSSSSTQTNIKRNSEPLHHESKSNTFNCLHGSYRHSFDGEFYDRVKINNHHNNSDKEAFKLNSSDLSKSAEMTIKCSKNLLAVETVEQGPATLQNYQKIPESEHDLLVDSLVASSGASSGEFNSSSDTTTATNSSGSGGNNGCSSSSSTSITSSNLYKRLSFGGRNSQNSKQEKNGDNAQAQQQDGGTDNSVTLNLTSSIIPTLKVVDLQRSSSSTSSSGDFLTKRERKKGAMTPQPEKTPLANLLSPSTTSSAANSNACSPISPEKAQRRKLLQMVSSYDQQNKILQRELAKEKRRRTEELACVVKSLLCFESKLKTDMKSVNQRLLEKDGEICRLVRQNRALRKRLCKLQEEASECARDEGVVEDGDNDMETKDLLEDCLVLEALQCINCRKQFYDIEVSDNCTQTTIGGGVGGGSLKDAGGSRNNDDPTTEHGSSSDDTVSSSFFGARRSVRYTSKRTSGTFRDYMRSRAMNIDDPALEADINSEEYPSTLSRGDDSQTSYDKLNIYSRTMERMHGVKSESERDSEHSGLETSSASMTRSNSRASTKSSKSSSSNATSKASELSNAMEEDDGIFSPTQDEDFEEEDSMQQGKLKIVRGRALEAFSEASPKQVYETSTDDWYASASDQEEIPGSMGAKCYGQGAVNPVLECVNQILLQQSMEGVEERSQTPKNSTTLPRRSSLSDRRNQRSNSRASDGATPNSGNGTLTRKRVHFSTKNSMVHVPRNDETEEDDDDVNEQQQRGELKTTTNMISNYQGMTSYITHSPALAESSQVERLETFNYESIYSNEYEPIGSELNSSNLYVDMESTNKTNNSGTESIVKNTKLPPALPPKPANLLKFKKSLQQLDESPDELIEAHNTETMVEPDYCSISEVNVGITSVQIRADIHRAPLSERDLESVEEHENDLDAATVISEANSQKTEEIEEIFADIPKLPNVAAIIAPKSSLKQNDYLTMAPKMDAKLGVLALTPNSNNSPNSTLTLHTPKTAKPDRASLRLNLNPVNSIMTNSLKSPKVESCALRPQISSANYQQHYKRKHMPNILQEINKRLSLPNSPITPTTPKSALYNKSSNEPESLTSLPLQAEFDWYNLDAEYGKSSQSDLTKVNESLNTGMPSLLADIKEDGECYISNADEYNLDEEYSNEMDQEHEHDLNDTSSAKLLMDSMSSLSEAINPPLSKDKKIKKNLANFEKFIENTSLTTKPLPSKRKIYFAGPFV